MSSRKGIKLFLLELLVTLEILKLPRGRIPFFVL